MKTAAITGITGQTGSYLAEYLLAHDYEVYGLIRKVSSFNTGRIDHIIENPNLKLIYGDLADAGSVNNFVMTSRPDLFFNMGAMSHVRVSFDIPSPTFDYDAGGVIRCLEAIRLYSPNTKFLQASTSELFGSTPAPQNEETKMAPQSPYAVAKLAAYWTVKNYRSGYGLFAVNSISFNHESKRRSSCFVTMKICRAAARIKYGLQDELVLGNLEAKRSWNHVLDVIDGMMLIMNADKPDDYVIGSNEMISVQEFVERVFAKLGIDWMRYVRIDKRYFRPNEVNELQPDATKIKTELGWQPKYTVDDIIDEMIEDSVRLAKQEVVLKRLP